MIAPGVRGIGLFKIAGHSISGWIPGLKTGNPHHVRQPFCSQLIDLTTVMLDRFVPLAFLHEPLPRSLPCSTTFCHEPLRNRKIDGTVDGSERRSTYTPLGNTSCLCDNK